MEDLTIQDKIEAILYWAEEHTWFDTEFIESLQEQYERTGSLSIKPEDALDTILEKFKINE